MDWSWRNVVKVQCIWCPAVSSEGHRRAVKQQTHTQGTKPKHLPSECEWAVSWSYLSHLIHGWLVSDSGSLSTSAIFKCLFTFSCCQWLAGRCIPTQMAAETWCLKRSGIQNNSTGYTTKQWVLITLQSTSATPDISGQPELCNLQVICSIYAPWTPTEYICSM